MSAQATGRHERPSRVRRLLPARKRAAVTATPGEAGTAGAGRQLREKLAGITPLPARPADAEIAGRLLDDLRALPAGEEPQQDPETTLLLRVPGPGGGPGFTIPPGFPSEWSADEDTMRQTLAALRGLDGGPQPGDSPVRLRAAMVDGPAAWLRAIMPGRRHPWEALPGRPSFAGIISDPDGLPYAGLYLGDADADGRMVIDVRDPRWLHELIGAAHEALDALEADGRAA